MTIARVRLLLLFFASLQIDVRFGSAAPQFTIRDLGPEEATFISDEGQILGNDLTESPWLWHSGQRVPLNIRGSANGVNRNGLVAGAFVAGVYQDSFGDFLPYYHAYLWSNGIVADLGTLGGRASQALSLNNSNVVVGTADDPTQVQRPFIWQMGSMSPLSFNPPGSGVWSVTMPQRVVDDGRIFATATFQGAPHAVLLSPRADGVYDLKDLGTLSGNSSLNAFNQFGWACGEGEFYPPLRVEAFLFSGGTTKLLGNLGSSGSYGFNLNDLGDVVGSSNSEAYRAFLWRDGSIYDLNSCIPTNSGWVLVDADGINNASQIVGHGMLNGNHHAFLLEPLPGSGQGLTLTLEPTVAPNQWRIRLVRQPTSNVNFEVSCDLVHWAPISYLRDGNAYLVEADGAPGPRFFRAGFRP